MLCDIKYITVTSVERFVCICRRFKAKDEDSPETETSLRSSLSTPMDNLPSTSSASSHQSQLSQSLLDPALRHRRELAYMAAARRMGQSYRHTDSWMHNIRL